MPFHRRLLGLVLGWPLVALAQAAVLPPPALAEPREDAVALANDRQFTAAHDLLDEILAESPDDLGAGLLRGILLVHEERWEEAVQMFAAVRDAHPERSEPYNNLAVAYVALDRLQEALAALRTAVTLTPSFPTVHRNLADLHLRLARQSSLRAGMAPATSNETLLLQSTPPDTGAGVVQRDTSASAPSRSRPTGTEGADAAPEPVPASPAGTDPSSGSGAACISSEGFSEPESVESAVAWLEQQGDGVEVLRRDHSVVRYRVYLPPLASRQEATVRMKALQAQGEADVAIIGEGELIHALSLGVYQSKANLDARVHSLKQKGHPVRVQVLRRSAGAFGFRARIDGSTPTLAEDWNARFPDHSLEIGNCP